MNAAGLGLASLCHKIDISSTIEALRRFVAIAGRDRNTAKPLPRRVGLADEVFFEVVGTSVGFDPQLVAHVNPPLKRGGWCVPYPC